MSGIEGQDMKWKQKSGFGITYGTDIGYFHAFKKTKLYPELIPGLGKSRQHFVHLDYPNREFSVGSIVQIQMFKSPNAPKAPLFERKSVTINGKTMIPTIRTAMGNYASIEIVGNMYEDAYSAPNKYKGKNK